MILQVDDLSASYGDLTVVKNVSLKVRSGEVVAVLGANGAGKSTLIRSIVSIHDNKSGRIVFDGEDLTAMPAHEIVERGLVMVPEHRRVFPRMSVMENLQMGGYLSDARTNRQTLVFVFDLFPRLKERASQRAGTLSGGEQQMLAIGRGLMAKPKLLILDEPSMGLAPLLVIEVYASLKRLVESEQITILLVEQNAREALSVAHRVYVMQRGEMTTEAAPDDVRGSLLRSYLDTPADAD
jgi:branched-chain amino acid transport system ATP-binding protein